ncbi:hypothetical protein PI124_g18523 [Phytophthora idaei]|nr:hypothetical protein PI125_g20759 [Phytophthora idaei]KAG3150879.1 hypothetical protein PI126_g11261 [Phytophthora idaei]KAG3236473.1 hypothetical protein PI124_g18523 [Phytophthora idaei]
MTSLTNSNSDAENNPPLTGLRMLKSQAPTDEHRHQLPREQRQTANKIERKEPKDTEKNKLKRKKRKLLQVVFHSFGPQVAPPSPPRVRVKIPIIYRNGRHKGVVVGGLRVPFSRPMQANCRSVLLSREDVSHSIPEDMELLLQFPDRLAWEEFDTQDTRKREEKKIQKKEKLARELAK